MIILSKAIIRLIRPRQWVKNLFVVAPFFFTPTIHDIVGFSSLLAGFFAFCMTSSFIYILNDYLDRESDSLHPEKKYRPIASGIITLPLASLLGISLLVIAVFLTSLLPIKFTIILGLYCLLNIFYCFFTKHLSILDVMSVAFGFVLRVEAGAALINVQASVWILLCTGFVALFLAFAKRRDDIIRKIDKNFKPALRGYNRIFLDIACTACLTSVLICYALYTNDASVARNFDNHNMYMTLPFVILGIFRYMQITFVEKKSGDPTKIVTSDKMILFSIVGWMLAVTCVIYL